MIEYLYEFWHWVLAGSAVLGVLSVLVVFRKNINQKASENIIVRIVANIVVIATGILVCLSCVIGMLFTKVPLVYGGTINEAKSKLNNVGLEIAFEPGINRDDNWKTIVSGQFPDEGSLVLQGSKIVVYLKTIQTDGESRRQDMITVPQVVGMEQFAATELLIRSGFQFQVWWSEENNVDAEEYYVINQSIPKGSVVSEGTLIKLELSPNKP